MRACQEQARWPPVSAADVTHALASWVRESFADTETRKRRKQHERDLASIRATYEDQTHDFRVPGTMTFAELEELVATHFGVAPKFARNVSFLLALCFCLLLTAFVASIIDCGAGTRITLCRARHLARAH